MVFAIFHLYQLWWQKRPLEVLLNILNPYISIEGMFGVPFTLLQFSMLWGTITSTVIKNVIIEIWNISSVYHFYVDDLKFIYVIGNEYDLIEFQGPKNYN